MTQVTPVLTALLLLTLSACDAQGVCVEKLDKTDACHERGKLDCESDQGTFHSYVNAPKDDSGTAKSFAVKETCATVGYTEAFIPGTYKKP